MDRMLIEKVKILDAKHDVDADEKLPPICKVWDWDVCRRTTRDDEYLIATKFENHPVLGNGSGGLLMTSDLLWIDYDLGMARTLNTLYKLM